MSDAVEKAKEILRETQDSYLKDELDESIETILNYIQQLEEINKEHQTQNGKLQVELTRSNKVIDLLAEVAVRLDRLRAEKEYDKPRIWETEEGIKQYFKNKVKEVC